MAQASHKVFVYGTLKKGQPNAYFMNVIEGAEYLGLAETCVKYPLIIGGDWNLPMLLDIEGQGKIVVGELYQVDDKALKQLDKFEGHPDFYVRREIQVDVSPAEGSEKMTGMRCWTYFINNYTEDDLKREYFRKMMSTPAILDTACELDAKCIMKSVIK